MELADSLQHQWDIDNTLSLLSIAVNALIGLWIAIIVQRNLTQSRAIKEFYIEEIKEIKKSYSNFINLIYKGDYSSKEIKDWFKVMSFRIESIQNSLGDNYIIDNIKIKDAHVDIQVYLTSCEEFNNDWAKTKLKISDSTKNDLIIKQSQFVKISTDSIISINIAKSNNWLNSVISKFKKKK